MLNYSQFWASNFCGSLLVAGCWKRFLDDRIPLGDCGTVEKPMSSSIKTLLYYIIGKKVTIFGMLFSILQANKGNMWFD